MKQESCLVWVTDDGQKFLYEHEAVSHKSNLDANVDKSVQAMAVKMACLELSNLADRVLMMVGEHEDLSVEDSEVIHSILVGIVRRLRADITRGRRDEERCN